MERYALAECTVAEQRRAFFEEAGTAASSSPGRLGRDGSGIMDVSGMGPQPGVENGSGEGSTFVVPSKRFLRASNGSIEIFSSAGFRVS